MVRPKEKKEGDFPTGDLYFSERGKLYWDKVNAYSSLDNDDAPRYVPAGDEGIFFQARLLHLGLNFTDAAKALGVTRRAVYNVLRNVDPLTRKMAAKLSALDPEFVLVPAWRIERKDASKKKRSSKS